MTQTRKSTLTADIQTRAVPFRGGMLDVHTHLVAGKIEREVFTLTSLQTVLGMSRSTLQGLISRRRLRSCLMNTVDAYGSAVSGFPLSMLHEVVASFENSRLKLGLVPGGLRTALPARTIVAPLEPIYFNGKPYYTLLAIARTFGVSKTTVWERVVSGGLLIHFERLSVNSSGGSAPIGIPHEFLGEVKVALCNAYRRDRVFAAIERARSDGTLKRAQKEMSEAVAVLQNSDIPLRAEDAERVSAIMARLNGITPS